MRGAGTERIDFSATEGVKLINFAPEASSRWQRPRTMCPVRDEMDIRVSSRRCVVTHG